MIKKTLCVVLALAISFLLTLLSSCDKQNVIKDAVVTSDNAEDTLNVLNEETNNQTETTTQTKPAAVTDAQTETKPAAETNAQTDTKPEAEINVQPQTQPHTQMQTQTEAHIQQPNEPNSTQPTVEEVKPSLPTASSLTKQSFNATNGSTLCFWLYTPENATDNMPLLIYLHGGSGKGDNLDILLQNGFPKLLSEGSLGKISAYVVIPQVSSTMKGWMDIKNSVRDLVYYCCKTYGTDLNRVSLTGHSMGGTGTWSLATAFPSLFSCIAPMSGSITVNDANIKALSGMPVWAFVGAADKIVKPDSSIQFIDALKKVNSNVQITIFDGADHFDVPGLAFQNDTIHIVQWLISQSK